eukprot:scaffold41841_cov67-Phaeocystis_antarctica.AAC.1
MSHVSYRLQSLAACEKVAKWHPPQATHQRAHIASEATVRSYGTHSADDGLSGTSVVLFVPQTPWKLRGTIEQLRADIAVTPAGILFVTLVPCDLTRPRAWRGKCCCEDEPTVVST